MKAFDDLQVMTRLRFKGDWCFVNGSFAIFANFGGADQPKYVVLSTDIWTKWKSQEIFIFYARPFSCAVDIFVENDVEIWLIAIFWANVCMFWSIISQKKYHLYHFQENVSSMLRLCLGTAAIITATGTVTTTVVMTTGETTTGETIATAETTAISAVTITAVATITDAINVSTFTCCFKTHCCFRITFPFWLLLVF